MAGKESSPTSFDPNFEPGETRIDRSDFLWKPKLFDVAISIDSGMVQFGNSGEMFLRAPEITGENLVIIPKKRQFLVIAKVYQDLREVVSEVSNSPALTNGLRLSEFAKQEAEKYFEEAERAQEDGLPPKIGNYLYDPLRESVIAVPPEEILYFAMRTSNSLYESGNLSLFEIWEKFRDTKIAFAGASVGSNIAEAVVRNVGPKKLKVADYDYATTGNITRLSRGNLFNLSDPASEVFDPLDPYSRPGKAVTLAREILLVDPYTEIDVYQEPLSEENMDEFLEGIDIVVEAIDNIEAKIELRKLARKKRVSLLMTSDVDGRVFADFYDYKNNPELPLVHGLEDEEVDDFLKKYRSGGRKEAVVLFKALIGEEVMDGPFGKWVNGEAEMATSSIPQHGATAMGAGYVGTEIIADYLLGKKVPKRVCVDPHKTELVLIK